MRAPSGNVLPGQLVRVAGAVVALVMVADRGQRVVEEAKVLDQARAHFGMATHDVPVDVAELLGLEEDRFGHGELADVVEAGGMTERLELCF